MKALGNQAEQLLAELRATNRHLDKVVQDLQINPLIKDASATLASVRQLTEETRKPLQEMLAASKEAAENLNQVMGQISSSNDLPASLGHLRHALGRLDRLVTSEQQDLEETINNLRQMSENFKAVSETARRNPSQLFFGTPPPRLLPQEGK